MKTTIPLIITCLAILVLTMSSCTQEEVKQLEGIIQQVDSENGEITIVTKDGQTITLKIDTETSVEAEGASSTIDTLEVGNTVQVEINEDDEIVQHIAAQKPKENTEVDKTPDTYKESDETVEDEYAKGKNEAETKGEDEVATSEEDTSEEDTSEEVKAPEDVTIKDMISEMEAERARLAEQIRVRQASGEVDAEWIREVEAERTRLAELIQELQTGKYKVEVIDGKAVAVLIEDPEGDTGTSEGDHPEDDHPEDDHPEDDYPEDDHPEDDHPEDDHPEE